MSNWLLQATMASTAVLGGGAREVRACDGYDRDPIPRSCGWRSGAFGC